MVDVDYEIVLAVTSNAVLLDHGNDEEIWWPIGQCPDLDGIEKGDGPGSFEAPEWLAKAKGVI